MFYGRHDNTQPRPQRQADFESLCASYLSSVFTFIHGCLVSHRQLGVYIKFAFKLYKSATWHLPSSPFRPDKSSPGLKRQEWLKGGDLLSLAEPSKAVLERSPWIFLQPNQRPSSPAGNSLITVDTPTIPTFMGQDLCSSTWLIQSSLKNYKGKRNPVA